MKDVLMKILILVLCFVITLSAVVSCEKKDDEVVDLQNQITDLQNQLTGSQNKVTDLQNQLDGSQNQVDDLENQLNDSQNRVDDLQNQLTGSKNEIDDLKGQLNDSQEQISNLQNQIEEYKKIDAAALETLKDLITQVKTAANSAVTAAALEKVTGDLTIVKGTVDALDRAVKLAEIEDDLKSLIEINNTDAALKAKLEDAVADVKAIAGETAADKVISGVEALVAELQVEIDAIESKVNSQIEGVNSSISGLQLTDNELNLSLVEVIEAQLDRVKALIEETPDVYNDFALEFANATKVLNGDAKVVVKLNENGSVAKVIVVDTDSELGDYYSVDAFYALTIDSTNYLETDYNDFLALQNDLLFFLARAISTESVVNCFRYLSDYIENIPTLNDRLAMMLAEKTIVTTDPDDLAEIEYIRNLILTNGGTVTEANQAAYDLVKAAHLNLLAAVEAGKIVTGTINAIAKPIVYENSKAALDAANADFAAFEKAYFTDKPEYTKFYKETAKTVVAGYKTLDTYNTRYEQLVAAVKAKVAVIEVALKFNTVRPLWSDYEALHDNVLAVEAWKTEFEIDEANYAKIYAGEELLLEKAEKYALDMKNIYEEHKVAELCANIDVILAKPTVLYTDYKTAYGYYDTVKALQNTIREYTKTSIVRDYNFKTMMGVERLDSFSAVLERMDELHNANLALDGYYISHVSLLGKIGFDHWGTIDMLGKNIKTIIDGVNVVVGDANYVAFAAEKDPFALYDVLLKEYTALVAKVREIYDTVNELLNNSNAIALAFGNDIPEFLAELTKLSVLGVTDIDLPLPGKTEADNANLMDLMEKLEIVIVDFCTKAEAAQLAAKEVAAAIATLANYKTNNLGDYAEIKAVKEVLDAWINEYLTADIEDANGDVAQALKNVATVQVYLGETGTYYVFVTEADYTDAVTVMTAAQAHYDAAFAEWTDLKAELERLTNLDWNIHNKVDFEAANDAYTAYVDKYYGGIIKTIVEGTANGIVITGGEFNEQGVYFAFVTERDKCYAYAAEATGKADEIKDLINKLASAIDYSNCEAQLVRIDEINALIENYKKYCTDICDDCIPEALRITLAEKEATARLYEYAAEVKAKANDATDAEIDKSVSLYAGIILAVKVGEVKDEGFDAMITAIFTALEQGQNTIDKKAPCVKDDTAHFDAAGDDNHICDYCDKAGITECADVETDKDHNCDECGEPATECVVANGTAHECNCGATTDCDVALNKAHACGVCGATSDCDVALNKSHTCDVCGATSDCTDTDPVDEKCDICGEDFIPFT